MSIEITGLADIVRQHAADRPDAAAIVHAGHKTTYAAARPGGQPRRQRA